MPLPRDPWLPAPYDDADMAALKALRDGTAQPHQQQRALAWVVQACGTYGPSFIPGDERASAFAEGRRWIGLQIVKLINLKPRESEDSEHG